MIRIVMSLICGALMFVWSQEARAEDGQFASACFGKNSTEDAKIDRPGTGGTQLRNKDSTTLTVSCPMGVVYEGNVTLTVFTRDYSNSNISCKMYVQYPNNLPFGDNGGSIGTATSSGNNGNIAGITLTGNISGTGIASMECTIPAKNGNNMSGLNAYILVYN